MLSGLGTAGQSVLLLLGKRVPGEGVTVLWWQEVQRWGRVPSAPGLVTTSLLESLDTSALPLQSHLYFAAHLTQAAWCSPQPWEVKRVTQSSFCYFL